MSAEPGSSTSPATPPSSTSTLHRIDDTLYAVERFVVVATMLIMVMMVFFDVLDRRLEAPESKMAALLFALGRLIGLRPGDGGAPWVASRLAPIVGAALVTALIWFGLATVRKRRGSGLAPGAEPLLALVGTGAFAALAWVMLHRPSNEFYALVWALSALGVGLSAFRSRAAGWQRAVAIAAGAGITGAILLHRIIPEGYSWAKEVAMILLVWTGFIGASMAAHQGRHIDIDFGKKMFPKNLRMPATVLAHLITVAFCGLLVVLGAIYVFGASGLYHLDGHFPHTGIPDWIVAFAIPWSFTLIGLRTLIAASRVLRGDLTAKGSSPDAVAPEIGHGAPKKEEG